MTDFNMFADNFYTMGVLMAKAPKGNMLNISTALICSSGQPYPDENYLLFSPNANSVHIDCATQLMPSFRIPYTVPIFPGCDEFMPQLLRDNGLKPGETHYAMGLDKCEMAMDPACERVTEENVKDFIETVWYGFDSGPDFDYEYADYIKYMALLPVTESYILRNEEGKAVSCGLLLDSGSVFGTYYFATLPDERRKGYARRLMNSLAARSFEKYESLVLLATEKGKPFYDSFGFADLGTVPVYRAEYKKEEL